MWKGAHVCPGSGQKTWHRSHPPAPCGAHPHGPACPPEAGPAGQEASQHPACPPGLSSKASLPRAVSQLAGPTPERPPPAHSAAGQAGPAGKHRRVLSSPPPSPQSHVWLSPAGLVEVRAEQRGRGRVSVDRAGLPSLVSLWAELPAPQLPAAGREATGSALRGLGRRFRQDTRGLLFGLWRSGRWQGTDGSRRASTCSWPRARRRGPPPCPSLTGGGPQPACPSRPCA